MHTRIVAIIHETQTLQKREIEQNKKNVNFSQADLDKFMMKQDDEQKQLLKLQASILQTNASIARHYAQMTADSLYLQKLDLIKPQFLQTLDATNANFATPVHPCVQTGQRRAQEGDAEHFGPFSKSNRV